MVQRKRGFSAVRDNKSSGDGCDVHDALLHDQGQTMIYVKLFMLSLPCYHFHVIIRHSMYIYGIGVESEAL